MKELRGTESTRKSIQKFKHNENSNGSNSTNDENSKTDGQQNGGHKPIPVCLAISHRGVEFIETQAKVEREFSYAIVKKVF